jgi:hypothetical protein
MYPQGNPYAAPAPNPYYRQNVFVPPGASAGPLPTPTLRKVKLASGIVQVAAIVLSIGLFVVAGALGNEDGSVAAIIGMLFMTLWYFVLIAYGIISMVWLYKIWCWFPPEQRHTKLWKKYISPGTAIGFMFIPYFNIYWIFVLYLGMADILERMMVQFPTSKESPRNLALTTLIVRLVFFPAAPFVDYIFAKHVESMATEMQARMGRPVGA